MQALHVRDSPKLFCAPSETPHAIALLLGQIVERDPKWRAEVHPQDPSLWLADHPPPPPLFGLWWVYIEHPGDDWRRMMKKEPPTWSEVNNPRVKDEYFNLRRDLNML